MTQSKCPVNHSEYLPPDLPAYLSDLPAVTEFSDVRQVFASKNFAQGGHHLSEDFIGGTLVNLEGRAHRERLRMARPLFSRSALLRYEEEILVPAVEDILNRQQPDQDGLVRCDLVPLARSILTRIAAAVIGLDDADSEERTERLVYLAGRLAAASRLQFAVGDRDRLKAEFLEEKREFVEEFITPSQQARQVMLEEFQRGEREESALRTDLLTILLRHQDESWDPDLINREVILYLVGSTLTTAMATPHAVFHLTNWLTAHPERREELRDVEMIRHIAYESMRLHVSSPAQIRRAVTDVELPDGRQVAAGQDVAVVASIANRSEEVYGAYPHAYDPDRTVHDQKTELYGHTFAEGTHRCLGEYLAAGVRPLPGKDQGTQGMVIRILSALVARNVRTDPDRAPRKETTTDADFYESFPVVFEVRA
jgi:cytochrome P450